MKAGLDGVLELARNAQTAADARSLNLRLLRHADDPAFLYYRFLHDLALAYGPFEALEIGTFVGVSAAHLAAHPGNRVVTVDSNPDAKRQADGLSLPNVQAVTSDSILYGRGLPGDRMFDVVFIDGNHTLNQAYAEYAQFRPHVRQGGLMLFDDIELPMATREMHAFWDFSVRDEKISLPWLHDTGFGAARIIGPPNMPTWEESIRELKRRQQEPGVERR